ncbi:MAG TPA: hypothetical protein DCZ01_07865, partial [Elusimicrobia bacterium]|nr:hypothetical protein [Elusimicrobiota bacterium]
MFKKPLASIVSAAVLVAGPGQLTLTAAAQTLTRGSATGGSVTPTIITGLNLPVLGASSFNVPTLAPGAPIAAAPLAGVVPAAAKTVPVAVPVPVAAKGSLAVSAFQEDKADVVEKAAALETLFENSSVAGRVTPEVLISVKSRAALEKVRAGGSVSETTTLGRRAWNAGLGMLGIGVKKLETPEILAQRIIDQINAQKPVYNRKVQEASTLVEKLRRQISSEEAKIADLETTITAILSDSDPANNILAEGMIKEQATLKASISFNQEQFVLAGRTLEVIKEERARFFSDREETLAKIQAGLTKAKSAQIQKEIAALKGGFEIGDLKDNMGRFEDAVDEKVAGAKGAVDAVESNPEEILKKAKDSLKNQAVQDEISKRKAAIAAAKKAKEQAGGFVAALAVGVAVVAVIALASAPFRRLLARSWNVLLGLFGMGVKRMETPEVMARRIIDQLNAQKPVYSRKVQEASTLVEKSRLQIAKQEAQSAELDLSVTAILSDSDPLNNIIAESLLKQKTTVDASTALMKEQLAISEKTLVSIKEERARFFSEREEMLAQIQAGLTKAKSAQIQKEIAALKGGFEIGDLKDNMGRFEDAVDEKVADAKGAVDSVESNPEEILKKAKDSLKSQEVQDEIGRRKAAIEAAKKAKEQAGGELTQGKALGYFAKVIGIGFALISPMLAALVFAAIGAMALLRAPEQGRWLGRQLAVIGLGTLAVGLIASVGVAQLGLTVGAFSVGIRFVVPAGIALAAGVIAAVRAHKKDGATVASVASTPAGSSVLTPAPVVAASEGAPSASSTSSPQLSPSIKPLLARAWSAILGIFGMGVKKLETPEILAQRLIDQLNAAKPVYNNKVREASTLVEKL